MPLNRIRRKCTVRYKLSRSQEKITHLMYMDNIRLFAKNEKELETLIHTVRIYSQEIGMEFGIEKCVMQVMKSGKRRMTDGMELPNQGKIRTHGENEIYKYLGILEADSIKQTEMKDKIKKEYLRRTRKLLEAKLSSRNLIKGINTWAVPLVRYSGPFLKWTREELKQMKRTYQHRKQRLRIDKTTRRLYRKARTITAIRNDTDNTIDDRMTITRKQKWEEKQFYGRFKLLINTISHQKTWTWLRKGNFRRETESLLIAAQNNAIRTNHIKARIDKTQQNCKCRLCGDRDETINHIISRCSKLAQNEYKTRQNWVGKVIHWEMWKKFKFDHTSKWYMHNPVPVQENDTHKLLWDFDTRTRVTRRPDLIIINKKKRREYVKLSILLSQLTTE